MRSCPRPHSSASAAERSALSTIASRITSAATFGSRRAAFASISSVSSDWSSDKLKFVLPQISRTIATSTPLKSATSFCA